MKIISFYLRHETWEDWKEIPIGPHINLIYSENNSTGKTTLMRAILYAFGFNIPNTEAINFEKYEFKTALVRRDVRYDIYRRNYSMIINGEPFDVVVDDRRIIRTIFGIENYELMDNLLGTIYFDQDKGWTLLNRGKIIANNRFNISSFLRGLNDDDSEESHNLSSRIKNLERKINEYKLLNNIAEYQLQVGDQDDSSGIWVDRFTEKEIEEIKLELSLINKEIEDVRKSIKENNDFYNYIEKAHIYVKNPTDDQNPIKVTRDSMVYGSDYYKINIARLDILEAKRSKLDRKLKELTIQLEQEIKLIDLDTLDESIAKRIRQLETISVSQVAKAKEELVKEKSKLENQLMVRTKTNNPYVERVNNDAIRLFNELDKTIKTIDIFTSNLKTRSGARLHKMVFAFKLAYNLSLNSRFNEKFIIFCDSPGGREVKKEIVDQTMSILEREFGESQIFIASIDEFKNIFTEANVIHMDGTLFNPKGIVQ